MKLNPKVFTGVNNGVYGILSDTSPDNSSCDPDIAAKMNQYFPGNGEINTLVTGQKCCDNKRYYYKLDDKAPRVMLYSDQGMTDLVQTMNLRAGSKCPY